MMLNNVNTLQTFEGGSQNDRLVIAHLTSEIENWAPLLFYIILVLLAFYALWYTSIAVADARLPGEDISSKMESAGTLLRFVDTGIFKWTARLLAGLCIFGAGWNLKEMRFGPAVISMIAAILFGTAPTWVKNIFSIGGADSIFSSIGDSSKETRIANLKSMKSRNYPRA